MMVSSAVRDLMEHSADDRDGSVAGGAEREPVEKAEPSGFVKARRTLGKLLLN